MAGPGDESAAAAGRGRGDLRASQADREQAIEALKTAFVEDRLTKDEFDLRVDQALTSRTYAELAAVTADIPVGLIAAQARGPARARARPPMSNPAKAGICAAIAIGAAAVLTFVTGGFALGLIVPFYSMALLAGVAQVLASRHEQRSRGQLPPRPGQGGQAPDIQQPGQVGPDPALPSDRPDQARPDQARPDQARADMRTHRSRPDRPGSSRCGARAPRGIRPVPGAA